MGCCLTSCIRNKSQPSFDCRTVTPRLAGRGTFRPFDVVVIDEVAQAVEASCFIPILLGSSKVVVAGDHCQLPPTVVSEEAARRGLALTLADRIVARFEKQGVDRGTNAVEHGAASSPAGEVSVLSAARGTRPVQMLDVQYRMNAVICTWASTELYGGRLTAAPAVAAHTLRDLSGVSLPPGGVISVSAAAIERAHSAAAESSLVATSPAADVATDVDTRASIDAGSGRSKRHSAKAGVPPELPAASAVRAALAGSVARAVRTSALLSRMPMSKASRAGDDAVANVEIDCDALACPMLFIDTAGCDGCEEVADASSDSKANVGEADVVVKHVLALLAAGVRAHDIAVVTPYNAQVGLLKALLAGVGGCSEGPAGGLEVRSVDGFQGKLVAVATTCGAGRGSKLLQHSNF